MTVNEVERKGTDGLFCQEERGGRDRDIERERKKEERDFKRDGDRKRLPQVVAGLLLCFIFWGILW